MASDSRASPGAAGTDEMGFSTNAAQAVLAGPTSPKSVENSRKRSIDDVVDLTSPPQGYLTKKTRISYEPCFITSDPSYEAPTPAPPPAPTPAPPQAPITAQGQCSLFKYGPNDLIVEDLLPTHPDLKNLNVSSKTKPRSKAKKVDDIPKQPRRTVTQTRKELINRNSSGKAHIPPKSISDHDSIEKWRFYANALEDYIIELKASLERHEGGPFVMQKLPQRPPICATEISLTRTPVFVDLTDPTPLATHTSTRTRPLNDNIHLEVSEMSAEDENKTLKTELARVREELAQRNEEQKNDGKALKYLINHLKAMNTWTCNLALQLGIPLETMPQPPACLREMVPDSLDEDEQGLNHVDNNDYGELSLVRDVSNSNAQAEPMHTYGGPVKEGLSTNNTESEIFGPGQVDDAPARILARPPPSHSSPGYTTSSTGAYHNSKSVGTNSQQSNPRRLNGLLPPQRSVESAPAVVYHGAQSDHANSLTNEQNHRRGTHEEIPVFSDIAAVVNVNSAKSVSKAVQKPKRRVRFDDASFRSNGQDVSTPAERPALDQSLTVNPQNLHLNGNFGANAMLRAWPNSQPQSCSIEFANNGFHSMTASTSFNGSGFATDGAHNNTSNVQFDTSAIEDGCTNKPMIQVNGADFIDNTIFEAGNAQPMTIDPQLLHMGLNGVPQNIQPNNMYLNVDGCWNTGEAFTDSVGTDTMSSTQSNQQIMDQFNDSNQIVGFSYGLPDMSCDDQFGAGLNDTDMDFGNFLDELRNAQWNNSDTVNTGTSTMSPYEPTLAPPTQPINQYPPPPCNISNQNETTQTDEFAGSGYAPAQPYPPPEFDNSVIELFGPC